MADVVVDVLGENKVAEAVAEINLFRNEAQNAADVAVSAVGDLTLYKLVPDAGSALLRLLDAEILPEIDLPANIGVRYLFRDAVGSGRIQFIIATIVDAAWATNLIGLAASAAPVSPADVTGSVDVPLVGQWPVDLVAAAGGLLTKNDGAQGVLQGEYVGGARLNFRDGGLFAAVEFDPADGAIYVEKLQPTPGQEAVINGVVDRAIIADRARPSGVFVPGMTVDTLRDWVTGVTIEGRELGSARYGIWKWEAIANRIQFYIKDWDRNIQIAQGAIGNGTAPVDYDAALSVKCTEGNAGPSAFTGITVTLTLDPDQAPDGIVVLNELGGYADAGFLPANFRTLEDQRAEFDRNAVARRAYFDPDDGYDSLDEAVRSTHMSPQTFDANENFAANVRSNEATSFHRIEIAPLSRNGAIAVEQVEGVVGGGTAVLGTITLPEWTDLQGYGLTLRTTDNARILEQNYSGAVRGIVFECDPPVVDEPDVTNYARHSDAPNGRSRKPVIGDTRFQQQRQFQLVEDCSFIGGANHRNWLDALSPQSGGYHRYDRCRGVRRNRATGQPIFGIHNGPAMSEPALIDHVATRADHLRGAAIQYLTGFVQDCGRSTMRLDGCDPFLVVAGCSMSLGYAEMPDAWAGRRSIEIIGYHEGAVSYEDAGALGLIIPTNASWSGGFFDELGEPDEFGRLPKLVLDGTTVALHSLAQRLNGKGAVTITVNGNSHVFNVANPATSTATLVAQANANLGANVLQLVRMDRFEAADVGFQRRVYVAPAGATITAGTALKRLGADVVRICAQDERPDGFALSPIVGGAAGTGGIMNTAPNVPGYYFPEVTGDEADVNRPFGLDVNGRISFAAAFKVGDVGGYAGGAGIVRWWR